METENLIATAEVHIEAPASKVWEALVNPQMIKQYMFGTTVTSNWTEGSPISWKGEWDGKFYEDKGKITKFIPGSKLHYTHYSPLTKQPDTPENYHNITIDLFELEAKTLVLLTQDNNDTEEDKANSEKNWMLMLTSLKELLEKR